MIAKIFTQKYKLLIIAALALWAGIIYSNSFSVPFTFDDKSNIVDNVSIRNLAHLNNIWKFWPTRFIGFFTFACNYYFGQLDVFGYHLVNYIVHAASGVLVWWLFLLIFSTPLIKKERIAAHGSVLAFFGALLFLSHPLQTEAVTYVFQRVTSLAAFFYLLSLCLYIKSRLAREASAKARQWRVPYITSLSVCIVSMFTKENAFTLPFTIMLCEFFFFGSIKREKFKYVLPFLFTLMVVPISLFVFKPQTFEVAEKILGKYSHGAVSAYALTQLHVLLVYIRLLILPLHQNLDYDYPLARSIFELPVFAGAFILSVILIFAARLFSRHRLLSFGIFWFFLTLLPESSIVPLGDFIFEHRLYLPMVGFCLFIVCGFHYLLGEKRNRLTVVLLSLLIAGYSAATYRRNMIWKDTVTLWNDAVSKSPKKPRPYSNRGLAYSQQGNLPQAIADYTRAIVIDPDFVEAYNNRGNAYVSQGNFIQGVSDFNKAIEVYPDYVEVYNNRGFAYDKQGNFSQAIVDYTRAIEMDPDFVEAYNNRGNAYISQDNFIQGMSDYSKAIEIDPDYAETYYNRGNAYGKQGKLAQAIADYTRAIEIDPDFVEAYNNRGFAYEKQGNFSQAIYDYNKAIEINPDLAVVYYNRGIAYFNQKDFEKAWKDVHKAESLGYEVNPMFIEELKKASGRDR